ncbi:copper homeostasis protein CutC [Dyella sp.]|uniref:copper homeostasis protein CutC n=1 Tax=Dyella sp. TaxID=1869338 RepID=UPI002ED28C98
MTLEIAANSVASAVAAQQGGASRVELCGGLELGGITPSPAIIAMVRERISVPVYVLIRPRAGDFLYNDDECEAMRRDIAWCVSQGIDGVVIGVLDAQGQVDVARCRPLVDAAGPMGITFHRAFDLAREPVRALEDVIGLGCERILTSGGQPSALEGSALIADLVGRASGRLSIMPGAGVTSANIRALAQVTGATEFHASAKRSIASGMSWRAQALQDMQGGEWRTDEQEVRALVAALAVA